MHAQRYREGCLTNIFENNAKYCAKYCAILYKLTAIWMQNAYNHPSRLRRSIYQLNNRSTIDAPRQRQALKIAAFMLEYTNYNVKSIPAACYTHTHIDKNIPDAHRSDARAVHTSRSRSRDDRSQSTQHRQFQRRTERRFSMIGVCVRTTCVRVCVYVVR